MIELKMFMLALEVLVSTCSTVEYPESCKRQLAICYKGEVKEFNDAQYARAFSICFDKRPEDRENSNIGIESIPTVE